MVIGMSPTAPSRSSTKVWPAGSAVRCRASPVVSRRTPDCRHLRERQTPPTRLERVLPQRRREAVEVLERVAPALAQGREHRRHRRPDQPPGQHLVVPPLRRMARSTSYRCRYGRAHGSTGGRTIRRAARAGADASAQGDGDDRRSSG